MSNIDQGRAMAVLQGMLGNAAFPTDPTPPYWVRLITAGGVTAATWATAAGAGSSAGTGEMAVTGGYVAGGLSGYFGAATAFTAGIPPTSAGPTAAAGLTWTNSSGGNWTIQGFELWDNQATHLRWWFGTFTGGQVTVNNGQVLSVAQNAITVTLG